MHVAISLSLLISWGCGGPPDTDDVPEAVDTSLDAAQDSGQTPVPTGPGVLVASPRIAELPLHAPDLTVDREGRVFVTWVEEDEQALRNIFLSRSDDGGATFEGPFSVAEPEDPRATWPHRPVVATTADHVWLAFSARDTGVSISVFVYRAPLAGPYAFELVTKFEMPVTYHDMVYPRLAVHPDGDVWIAWIASPTGYEGELWVARERFGWASENVTANSGLQVPCECCPPDLAIRESGEAWVAWRGDRVRDVYVGRTSDPTVPFGAFEQITDFGVIEDVCPLDGPRLLEVAGTLHAGMSDTHLESPRAWLGTYAEAEGWAIVALPEADDAQSRVFLASDVAGGLYAGYETSFQGDYRYVRRRLGADSFDPPLDVLGPEGPLQQVQARAVGDAVGAVGVDETGNLWFVLLGAEAP